MSPVQKNTDQRTAKEDGVLEETNPVEVKEATREELVDPNVGLAREDGLPVTVKLPRDEHLYETYVPKPWETPLDHAAILAREDAKRAEYLARQREKDLEPAQNENDMGWTVQHSDNPDRMKEEKKAYEARQKKDSTESEKNDKVEDDK
jgi:hypothetical protein